MIAFSLSRVPIVVMALFLASCTSGGTFGYRDQFGSQIDSAFNYGAGGRDFSTVVVGNPFGGDQQGRQRRRQLLGALPQGEGAYRHGFQGRLRRVIIKDLWC